MSSLVKMRKVKIHFSVNDDGRKCVINGLFVVQILLLRGGRSIKK
jgi:hypothetical protein